MNDTIKMENFISLMLSAERNGIDVDESFVYSNLIKYNTKAFNSSKINNNFDLWIKDFENISNIDVYVKEDWNYFCLFKNGIVDSSKLIKMYIALDDKHIYEGAKQIFKFLADNKIVHTSKIGSDVRIDDIVIRVENIEDVKKIRSFIFNNEYIKEGIMDINPFAFNDGYISYAWDGGYSFNSVLSSYISNYIYELKKNNQLHLGSYNNFLQYLHIKYNNVFNKGIGIKEYINEMDLNDDYINEVLVDYEGITKMLLVSTSQNKPINNFENVYNAILYNRPMVSDRINNFLSNENTNYILMKIILIMKQYGRIYIQQCLINTKDMTLILEF